MDVADGDGNEEDPSEGGSGGLDSSADGGTDDGTSGADADDDEDDAEDDVADGADAGPAEDSDARSDSGRMGLSLSTTYVRCRTDGLMVTDLPFLAWTCSSYSSRGIRMRFP